MFLNSNKFNRFSDQWTFHLHHNKGLPKNVFTSLYGVLSLPDDVVLIRACRSVCVATKKESELRKGTFYRTHFDIKAKFLLDFLQNIDILQKFC